MDWRFFRNVLIKGLVLFVILNLLFAILPPLGLGRISLYNHILTGRERFPFGENPAKAYNLSLYDLDAMFASHVLSGEEKPLEEYRVLLIGDSSIWGTLLKPEENLAGLLNAAQLVTCDNRKVKIYNLGYPTLSLMKDLMILDQAKQHQPDLIVWPVTLESFPVERQLTSPIVANNAMRVVTLIERYDLDLDPNDTTLVWPTTWDRTIIGQRRALADLLRLQIYGILWAATGVDQVYPRDYQPAQVDFDEDVSFHDRQPPTLDPAKLSFDVLEAGFSAAGDIEVLIVNEPILISTGVNGHLRYNFFYPRWAYDQYRQMMAERAAQNDWHYLDLWNIVSSDEFTNSAIHMTPAGENLLATRVAKSILTEACDK